MMEAQGRMLKKPVCSFVAGEDEITMRVDCEENSEFWFTLRIDKQTLETMLAVVKRTTLCLESSKELAILCCRLTEEASDSGDKPQGGQ
jgi:hypothetical protein